MSTMTIGNQLKKAREQKQLSLDDAYQHTRILPEMLSALEEDNLARIANPVYIKSFLKKYSSYLGLSVENILNQYNSLDKQESLNVPEPAVDKEKFLAQKIDVDKITKALKVIFKSILIIFLLILFIKTTGRVKSKFSSWRKTRAQHVSQAQQVESAEKVKSVKKKEIEVIKEKPKVRVQETSKSIQIPQNEKLTLVIKTTKDVWVELRKDTKIILKNVLKKGSEETWQAVDNFELWTGNAAAMNITLNGHDLGSPGKGVKKGIIINRQGIQK